ncbi:MAG: CZB domain-containing protein [Leptospiraceae bacterium]|nr:CZB domain-containing protein [Leptospiraceae bacterium]
MDLNNAVQTHADWKVKFRKAIQNKEQLDALTILKDNCCELGKWLYGEAKNNFSSLPSYSSCLEAHKSFHLVAGKVAGLINDKKYTEAEAALENNSEYSNASNEVVKKILNLKRDAAL